MDVGRSKWQQYRVAMSAEAPGDVRCITIMKPDEDWRAASRRRPADEMSVSAVGDAGDVPP
jgi:hypothetical protein